MNNFNLGTDEYEKLICEALNKKILNKIESDSNKSWTKAVFEILSECKNKNTKIACSSLQEENRDCGEWLFDYVEYTESLEIELSNGLYNILSEIILVVECEWEFYKNQNYFMNLKYDFEKLLVAKSNYRLFIFEGNSIEMIQKTILDLKYIAKNFSKLNKNERILFAGWEKGKEFYFDILIK